MEYGKKDFGERILYKIFEHLCWYVNSTKWLNKNTEDFKIIGMIIVMKLKIKRTLLIILSLSVGLLPLISCRQTLAELEEYKPDWFIHAGAWNRAWRRRRDFCQWIQANYNMDWNSCAARDNHRKHSIQPYSFAAPNNSGRAIRQSRRVASGYQQYNYGKKWSAQSFSNWRSFAFCEGVESDESYEI